MKWTWNILVAVALTGCFATAGSDGQVASGEAEFRVVLPVVLPPLVVIEPGVSVVRDYDEEVFHADGYYWVRQDRSWYRSRDHRSGWVRVDQRHVPAPVARAPPGRYRHYHGGGHERDDQGQGPSQGRENHDGRGTHDGRDDDHR